MLARLFVLIGGVIVLALTVALVGPYFVDWTSYRADFEREASAVLGRQVTVQGEASARLLPFPSVTFTDVAVAGGKGGEPALTIGTFSMDAELAPFLRGEFLIFDMRLVRPKGIIDVAADGTIDWTVRPSAPFDASQISLENLTVTEGQITIRHAASGRTHVLSEINTEVSAKSLAGPWRATGTLRLDGMHTVVSVSTGSIDESGGMRLRVRAEPALYPIRIEADGNIRLDKGAAVYSGLFKAGGKDDDTATAATAKVAKVLPGYRLNGKFTLDHKKLLIDEFLFETGPLDNPYSAEGKGMVDFGAEPRFALSMDGAQVRFDEAVGAAEKGSGLTLAARLAALEKALADLPKPTIPGSIDVNLPAIVAGDTTIRDVRLSAEPAEGGWKVKSFAATLPGRTTLEADGNFQTENGLGFSGSLLLAVGQPSGFAAWLSKDVDDAIRRLPAAGFHAKVELTPEKQDFNDLELVLGNATFRGEAERRQPADAEPSIIARLEGGELDVDGLAAFGSLFVSDLGANRFADQNLDLQVKAGPVSAAGMVADTVDAAFRMRQGALEVDRLSIGGLDGATVSATGTIRDFPEKPSGNLDATVVAEDLAPLVATLAGRYKDNPLLAGLNARAAAYRGLLEDARVDVVATLAENDDATSGVAVSLQGKAGGTALSATLSGNGSLGSLGKAQLSLNATGRNDDATALVALYGLPVLPLGLIGAGETNLSAKGTLEGGIATAANLTGNDFTGSFDGTASLGADGVAAKGKVKLVAGDIEPWLMTVGTGLPGMGQGLRVELETDADYAKDLLVLGDLSGTVDEGAVAGDFNVDIKDAKPHITGQAVVDELVLDPLAAMVLGEAALESAGASWSDVPFQPQSTAPFSADLDVTAATLSAGPQVNAYDATLSLTLNDDGLRVSDLSAKLFGGTVTGLFELKNNEGTGLLSGQVKLAGADLTMALGETGVSGTADFSTAVSASGKSIGGLVAALSGSGTAALPSLDIAGVNPEALQPFIASADVIGKDIDAARTAAFAPEIASAGHFVSGPSEAAFTVAGGVLRAPPLKLDNPAATIEADVQADLNTGLVSADGTIAYQPGDEALVGSEPALRFNIEGPIGETSRIFDSEPLAQFLTQRALEIEQARVEAMQSALLEKQRLRREVRYYAALQTERERAAEELRRKQEEARLAAEAEARAKQEAEEKARLEAEAEAKAKLEAMEQARLEAEAKARQAEEARKKQEQDAALRKANDAVRLAAEEEARRAAEQKPRPPAPVVRRPAPQAAEEPVERRKLFKPFAIDDFLKSLGGG